MHNYRLALSALIIALILLSTTAFQPVQAADQVCFNETNQCMSGRIREFWEQNGGLAVFGYPVTPQYEDTIEGTKLQLQWFERVRLELHPENARPYDVLLGRLGVDRLAQQSRDWFAFAKSGNQPGCRYFPETDQSACGDILKAWHTNGLEVDGKRGLTEAENLALFGMPISSPQVETLDGKEYTVQWFERARFEIHPENQPPYNVLLGLLGNEIRTGGSAPAPQPQQPTPVSTTAAAQPKPLPAPTFNNCQADPNPGAAPNYPIQIVRIDKGAETVTLHNVSGEAVDLTGWRMCSIKGNQQHPVSGTLAPNEERTFPGVEGSIWSNDEQDDGALYNANGQLVSYYFD